VVVPKTIGGVEVKALGSSAFESTGVNSVIIPDTVTSVGEGGFTFVGTNISHLTIP